MIRAFQPLIQSLATAPSEQALRYRFMDAISDCFGVQSWGLYLMNEQHLAEFEVVGVSETFVERYEQIGRAVDPVWRYVLEHHAPAHEALVLPNGSWKQSDLYQRCCAEYDHAHIMTGPIVGQGQLIGTVQLARGGESPTFDTLDLLRLSAVCSHFSACLAQLRRPPIPNPWLDCLTARELQIAQLVAQGLTNSEIGTELWISPNSVKQALKRMFRKLNVSARTEMVAKLRDRV
jgi:DNA-binding CsgD family transcriptional regulator